MATVIKKSSDHATGAEPVAFSFEDVSRQALRRADEARQEAAAILAEARREAEQIRRRAEETGRQLGIQSAEQAFAEKIDEALRSIGVIANELADARQTWLQRWEKQGVQLAAKMADRIVRREIERDPGITLGLVREALEMSAASPQLRLMMNPADVAMLGDHAEKLIREIAPAAKAQLIASPTVSRGGCRLETTSGVVDQQIETQLNRIVAELVDGSD
jgi:flagellar assembly protein FliH